MPIGKVLLFVGLAIAAVGAVLWKMPALFSWFGKLPGDFHYEKEGVSIHFPFASMIVISVVLSLLLSLLGRR
jgi:hypothetical protein